MVVSVEASDVASSEGSWTSRIEEEIKRTQNSGLPKVVGASQYRKVRERDYSFLVEDPVLADREFNDPHCDLLASTQKMSTFVS